LAKTVASYRENEGKSIQLNALGIREYNKEFAGRYLLWVLFHYFFKG